MDDSSILNSVKEALGIVPEYNSFDNTIIDYINSTFAILNQLGVGPDEGYSIKDQTNIWDEYIGDNKVLNMVKTYMNKKVGLAFDPPMTSSIMEAQNEIVKEMEFRLQIACDHKE